MSRTIAIGGQTTRADFLYSFDLADRRWQLDLMTYAAVPLGPAAPPPARDPAESPSPDGKWIARVEGNNVWVRSPADGRSIQLTTDGADRNGYVAPPRATLDWSPTGTPPRLMR